MNAPLLRLWSWTRKVFPWALAALVLTLVARQARTVEWTEVWTAVLAIPATQLALAVGLAALSYALYGSFDLVGRRLTRAPVSVGRSLGTAAISYAFNLNFGSLVGGLALRLRLYTRWGLSAPTVGKIIAYSMVTNWLGYLWVAGAVWWWAPPRLPEAWVSSPLWWRGVGMAMLLVAAAYVALCFFSRRRELSVRGHALPLPDGRLALLQAAMGGASWLLIGAIVWSLFGGRIDYPAVLGALLLAAVAGVVTHVPAGLGVLEAVFAASLGGARWPVAEVLAVVLVYRAAYYLLPLVFALPAYGLSEAAARRRSGAGQAVGEAPV
ncbi:MAG: lysylphosphatidylglycerol synthase domain-containing protein [Hydrogenophaga sp.]|uniref:lysylphosphatidylglycerol synthase domain-containing protein n=1 Tax=Hydrogenophaga sp. TaxID=1904254 RepID=UPI003D0A023E